MDDDQYKLDELDPEWETREKRGIDEEKLIEKMTEREEKRKKKKRQKRMRERAREDDDDNDLMLSARYNQEYLEDMQRMNQDGTYNDNDDDDDDDDDEDDVMNVEDEEWVQVMRKTDRRIEKRIGEDGRRQMAAGRDERSKRRNNQKKREREDSEIEISEESDEDEYSEEEKKEKKERRGRPKKKPKVQKKKKKKMMMMSTDDSEDEEDEEEEDESEDEEEDESEDEEEDESEDEEKDKKYENPWSAKASNKAQLKMLQIGCLVWVMQRYEEVLKYPSVLWIGKVVRYERTKIRVRWLTSDNPVQGKNRPGRRKQPAGPKQLTWGPWRETKKEQIIERKIVRLVIELNPSGTIKANSREMIQRWMKDFVLPMWLANYDDDYEKRMRKAKHDKQKHKLLNKEFQSKKKQLLNKVLAAMSSCD